MNVAAPMSDIAMTLGLLMAVALVGLPSEILIAKISRTTSLIIGRSFLLGFSWISVLSWYAFKAGIKVGSLYRITYVVAFMVTASICILAIRRGTLWHRCGMISACSDIGVDLVGFGVCAASYVVLVSLNLNSADLRWPTIFNADIFVYVKSANYLSLFPDAYPVVSSTNLSAFLSSDVFGCFNLIALARFVFRTDVSHVVVAVMALGVGLVGLAVARCCRVIFGLGTVLSTLIALVTVTGPLFEYISLNYFLSQIVFVSILMTAALWSLEVESRGWRWSAACGLVMWASAACVLLAYDVWSFQFIVILSTVMAVAGSSRPGSTAAMRLATGLLSFFGLVAVGLAGLACASPSRLANAVAKLASLSVPNVAGWLLPFVDLDLLLGLPVDWRIEPGSGTAIFGPMLGFVMLIAVVGLSAARLDRTRGYAPRLIALGLFCSAAMTYVLVWLRFGETYQQWKFASTLPLGFGFTVLATIIGLARIDASRRRSVFVGAAATVFLIGCIWLNISLARSKWLATMAHIPATMERLADLDHEADDLPVYVNVADFQARMAALTFVNRKPLTFDGVSQFGPGGPPARRTALCRGQGGLRSLRSAPPDLCRPALFIPPLSRHPSRSSHHGLARRGLVPVAVRVRRPGTLGAAKRGSSRVLATPLRLRSHVRPRLGRARRYVAPSSRTSLRRSGPSSA